MSGDNSIENTEQYSRFKRLIIPKIVDALGRSGKSLLRAEIKVPNESHFISSIYMVELTLASSKKEKESENERVELVVKMPPDNEGTKIFMRTDILFRNEIIFYQRLKKNCVDYPRCVFLIPKPLDESVIVLENLTQFGFKGIPPKQNIGIKRALAAVKEIAKFHARNYLLKENSPDEFFGISNKLRESMFDTSANPVIIDYINRISVRPIDYLRSVNYDPEFCDKIEIIFKNSHERILNDCIKPRNELAVLCHGDFTGNNVLFKEESDGEFTAKLIDFAQLRYASPATDISTFLHLSCEIEVRKKFSIIFKAYHDTVFEYLEKNGVKDLDKYSFDAFANDYKRHAIIGCEIAIYFMPVMYLDYKTDLDDFFKNLSKHVEKLLISGGDEVSKTLADMIIELKNNGCLNHLI